MSATVISQDVTNSEPVKRWKKLSPQVRSTIVTCLMVGATVYVVNKLGSSTTPPVEAVTVIDTVQL